MESKTIRVKLAFVPGDGRNRYDDADGNVTVYAGGGAQELDITITPIASPEERLREARKSALGGAGWHNETPVLGWASLNEILAIIERVDAEFAKGEKDAG